jgi:hypothetical protein
MSFAEVDYDYLLAETNTRPSIKGKEDERIRRQILVQTIIDESVWIEFHCCGE